MYCISISHKKAPVSVRERFAFTAGEKNNLIRRLVGEEGITGCVVLCTCNRSEIYVSGDKKAVDTLQHVAADAGGTGWEELLRYVNVYGGEQAIAHLFKVCCGFDSKVLGEDEILGQVKDAYQLALEEKSADYELNVLFLRAITCAKKIKTDTDISRTPLSVATLVAHEVFHFNKEGTKKVLVIGMSGKMGSTITKNLLSRPGIEVTGTVRSHKPDFLSQVRSGQVQAVDYHDRYAYMEEADIIISATSGPHYTVTYDRLAEAVTEGKERLLIDVAVPVDMDPQVQRITGVTLRNIDYFEMQTKDNSKIKLKELDRAKAIMEEELDGAVKEMAFHPYIGRLPQLREALHGKSLDTLLFKIRDHVDSGDLKVILKTLDQLPGWLDER